MIEITMPRLSDSMEEGTLLKWLKADGDRVGRGDELAEIETDKATMTFEADAEGFLRTVANEGDTLPVGTTIAHLLTRPQEEGLTTDRPAPSATDQSAEGAGQLPLPASAPEVPADFQANATLAVAERPRNRASPLARRLARERGVELRALAGTGPGGRIVRADVEAAAGKAPTVAAPTPVVPPPAAPPPAAPAPAATGTAKGDVTVIELTRSQQVVARRMAEAKATIPEFTLTADIDMTDAVALRAQLKALHQPPSPSLNDMIVRACALALREYPRANGAYRDGRFELYSRVNVGVAVAALDALVVPTVFDADQRPLTDIAQTTRALAERARSGQIRPPELSGATFTVSNLGMYGVTSFTAVINPPQAAILAVAALAPRAVPDGDGFAARQLMPVTLACDHRILYGADAAQLLARIRALLERPLALLAR